MFNTYAYKLHNCIYQDDENSEISTSAEESKQDLHLHQN